VAERDDLPLIDEHERRIDADQEQVWAALGRMLARPDSLPTTIVMRLVGVRPYRASGDPLYEGATIAGFTVTRAVRPEILRLEGRHRFSRYALTFRLREAGNATTVTAESRAEFPGMAGTAYRALVVGTGGHVVAVRRLLARIAAEVTRYDVIARRDVGGSPSSR
jgi:hypothetical protein